MRNTYETHNHSGGSTREKKKKSVLFIAAPTTPKACT